VLCYYSDEVCSILPNLPPLKRTYLTLYQDLEDGTSRSEHSDEIVPGRPESRACACARKRAQRTTWRGACQSGRTTQIDACRCCELAQEHPKLRTLGRRSCFICAIEQGSFGVGEVVDGGASTHDGRHHRPGISLVFIQLRKRSVLSIIQSRTPIRFIAFWYARQLWMPCERRMLLSRPTM